MSMVTPVERGWVSVEVPYNSPIENNPELVFTKSA